MPYFQISSLVIEHSLPPQLHAEDEEAEQLRESSAKDIEAEIHLKTISQIRESVLPERTMLMSGIDDARYLVESGMVNLKTCQQAEKFHRLDS